MLERNNNNLQPKRIEEILLLCHLKIVMQYLSSSEIGIFNRYLTPSLGETITRHLENQYWRSILIFHYPQLASEYLEDKAEKNYRMLFHSINDKQSTRMYNNNFRVKNVSQSSINNFKKIKELYFHNEKNQSDWPKLNKQIYMQDRTGSTITVWANKFGFHSILESYFAELASQYNSADLSSALSYLNHAILCYKPITFIENFLSSLSTGEPSIESEEKGHLILTKYQLNDFINGVIDGNQQQPPIFTAILTSQIEVVQLLISLGAKVNVVDSNNGYTTLHYAADYSTKEIFELLCHSLIGFKAKRSLYSALTHENRTVYHLAGRRGKIDILNSILEINYLADIQQADARGFTALTLAILAGQTYAFEWFLNEYIQRNYALNFDKKVIVKLNKNESERTVLQIAVQQGCLRITKGLLIAGAGLHCTVEAYRVLLSYAINQGHHSLITLLLKYKVQKLKENQQLDDELLFIIQNQFCKPNEADILSFVFLTEVKLLIEHGANPNKNDVKGHNSLTYILWSISLQKNLSQSIAIFNLFITQGGNLQIAHVILLRYDLVMNNKQFKQLLDSCLAQNKKETALEKQAAEIVELELQNLRPAFIKAQPITSYPQLTFSPANLLTDREEKPSKAPDFKKSAYLD